MERQKRKAEEDEEAPEQVVLHSPDGNFTVYKRCSPVAKRWCSLNRIHSEKYHGEMVIPVEEETADTKNTNEIGFEFYQKCDDVEFGGEEGVELFRMTPLMYDDEYFSSQDSQDSNAEHYYTNDYPEDYWSD